MGKSLGTAAVLAALCLAASALVQPAQAMSDADAMKAATTVFMAIQEAYNADKAADVAALFVEGGV